MKPLKFSIIVAGIISLACGMGNLLPVSHANNVATTLPLPAIEPSPTNAPIPALTPAFSFSTPWAPPFPEWVKNFSDPILASLSSQRPEFEDDFSLVCVDEKNGWKLCSTPWPRTLFPSTATLVTASPTLDIQPDLQSGLSILNKGWFYFLSDGSQKPYYANFDNEALQLKLPAGKENRDFWVYNPKLIRNHFVLSLDLQFEESQPNDTVRFQFSQTEDRSVAIDLSKNKKWTLHWGQHTDWQSTSGTFDYFAPEPIAVLIIMEGEECAVYLNNAPLTYLNKCRTEPIARPVPWSVTFHMLAEPGHVAAALIDNVKLWGLDKP